MAILTQAPDPNPKTPKLKPPPGACDTHVHLFGPSGKYPFASDSPYTSRDALPETLFALQDKLGLSTAVVVSPGGYGRNAAMLCDVLAKHGKRLRGIALMPDDAPDAEFARLTALGVKGLRMMSVKRGAHVPHLNTETAARAHAHGWHVQFYPHGTDIVEYADKLLALKNDVVLDHFASLPAAGGVDQPAMKAVMRMLDSGRVWLKLSGPMRCTPGDFPYAPVTQLARALVRHTPERLVWGSDWPHVNMDGRGMPNDGDLLDMMLEWCPDEAVRNRILADNAKKLYGFG
ncbi:MAG: amidohydrolase [Alphaproteobacteria bacterium]|nr:amidohydrolase [Alphaproteobacteria bacterium]